MIVAVAIELFITCLMRGVCVCVCVGNGVGDSTPPPPTPHHLVAPHQKCWKINKLSWKYYETRKYKTVDSHDVDENHNLDMESVVKL